MRTSEGQKIDKLFTNNPKILHHSVEVNKIEVEKLPEKEEGKTFWEGCKIQQKFVVVT